MMEAGKGRGARGAAGLLGLCLLAVMLGLLLACRGPR